MRCNSFFHSLFLLAALPVDAAPRVSSLSDVTAPPSTVDSDFSPAAALDSFNELSTPSNQPVSQSFDGQPEPLHVVIPCQGCSESGADEYPLFAFDLKRRDSGLCDVVFSVNGTAVLLTKSSSASDLVVDSVESDRYRLHAELTCDSGSLDPNTAGPLYLTVYLQAINATWLTPPPGVVLRTNRQAQVPSIETFRPIKANAEPTNASLEPVSHAVDDRLSVQEGLDNQTGEAIGGGSTIVSDQPNEVELASGQCSHERKENSQDAHNCISRHICKALHSLLGHLQSTLGEERTAYYKDKVQAAMTVSSKAPKVCDADKVIIEKGEMKTSHVEVAETPVARDDQLAKFVKVQTPLVIALESLASALGLAALLAFLRRHCCSLRRKVERLADREERMKRKEYRRAARKEAWRKRWAKAKGSCLCSFGTSDCDDEIEKAALVTHAAEHGFLPEVTDVEGGMAQLEGLQYAHEIVAQMARSRIPNDAEYASRMATAYPYAPAHSNRSRASSLPSYNSEMLPDYSSQPGSADLGRGMRVADGLKRPNSRASTTASSGCTPDSSIPEISPRVSAETLRTRYSRE